MKQFQTKLKFLLILLLLSIEVSTYAKLTMPVLFSDNMVLQQKTEAPVWGNCKPGHKVQVATSWDNKLYNTIADKSGNWMLKVITPEAGGPYKLTVLAEDKLIFNNVMIGEVWICSGQSNMEMPLAGWGKVNNYQNEIANANHPNIRLFQVEKSSKLSPVKELKVMGNSWLVCSPNTVPEFSATAYFFAVNLSKALNNIPIGLIHTSWGGTPAEAWTSKQSLQQMPDFQDFLSNLKQVPTDPAGQKKYIDNELQAYQNQLIEKDRGYIDGKYIWTNPDLDDKSWKTMYVPKNWEEQSLKDFDGVVWFRKEINIPANLTDKDLILHLGTVDDNDITFFNGEKIGATDGWDKERTYKIPSNLIKAGKNIISIRVFDQQNTGGFYGNPGNLYVCNSDSTEKIFLSGNWKFKIGFNLNEITPPKVTLSQNQPTVLFNGMINPLIPYSFQGVIWYQGESNEFRAEQYSRLFPLLIHDWRSYWKKEFPFYFVQLANYKKRNPNPVKAEWAELREAQEKALNLENTGMAVIIDIGEGDNIHPKNKQEVGRRLALEAENKTYGIDVVSSGPQFDSFKIKGTKIEISYKSIGNGLVIHNGDTLKGFAVAGVDKQFYWAEAKIENNKVVVCSHEVEFPIAVRYAWANNPDCNLYNKEGLPAVPFRTDDWDE